VGAWVGSINSSPPLPLLVSLVGQPHPHLHHGHRAALLTWRPRLLRRAHLAQARRRNQCSQSPHCAPRQRETEAAPRTWRTQNGVRGARAGAASWPNAGATHAAHNQLSSQQARSPQGQGRVATAHGFCGCHRWLVASSDGHAPLWRAPLPSHTLKLKKKKKKNQLFTCSWTS
jgi:hypothetical protein